MSNNHIDPVMRGILGALQVPNATVRAVMNNVTIHPDFRSALEEVQRTPYSTIVAAIARIRELEVELRKVTNERNLLRRFCDTFDDYEQVMPGETEATPVDQDVVVAALKVLMSRHANEFEQIVEPLYQQWLREYAR